MLSRTLLAAVCPLLLAFGLGAQDVPRRPQVPTPPLPYKAVDVAFRARDGATIAGTFTFPTAGAHAAVVLLAGSGPTDRDSTMAGHKPFLVLADYLTRRGFVVLRTDSRGTGRSSGTYFDANGDTLAHDALDAVAFLRGRPEVAPNPVGLIGLSLGAAVASLAAADSPTVDWIVLLSGQGRPDVENGADRVREAMRKKKASEAEVDAMVAVLRKVTGNPDAPDTAADLKRLTALLVGDALPAEALDSSTDAQVKTMRSPWGRYFGSYDPRTALRKVKCPVLAIGGSLDKALPARENLSQIHDALRRAGNPDATVVELFGVNHLMQTATTGEPTEIATLEETMSPRVMSMVAGWLRERTTGAK